MASNSRYKQGCYTFYNGLRDLIIPGLNNSQYEYKDLLTHYVRSETRWLDLGCGHEFFPTWMTQGKEIGKDLVSKCRQIVGIDCDIPSVKNNLFIRQLVIGDGGHLPFQSESFNLVTANMVMEHIEYPDLVLREIGRVLEPGGIFLFHTPNYLNYMTILAASLPNKFKLQLIGLLEGRKECDIFPTFYRFNTPKGIAAYSSKQGFEVKNMIMTKSSAETIMLGPVVVLELMITKVCEWPLLKNFRSIIIGVLKKR
jgi:ubiquinone/menaquinone biosynthesis C-methylase UbiE